MRGEHLIEFIAQNWLTSRGDLNGDGIMNFVDYAQMMKLPKRIKVEWQGGVFEVNDPINIEIE